MFWVSHSPKSWALAACLVNHDSLCWEDKTVKCLLLHCHWTLSHKQAHICMPTSPYHICCRYDRIPRLVCQADTPRQLLRATCMWPICLGMTANLVRSFHTLSMFHTSWHLWFNFAVEHLSIQVQSHIRSIWRSCYNMPGTLHQSRFRIQTQVLPCSWQTRACDAVCHEIN